MRRAAVLACLIAGACAPASPSPAAPAPASSATAATSFAPWLSARREELAAIDPRLALRLHVQPGVASQRAVFDAILGADEGLRVSGTGIDVLSFDARARALDRVAASVASPPRFAPGGSGDRLALELLTRVVAEERGRVDEERALPASASALVRAVVTTWSAPTTPDELRARDRWLAARLDEVGASLPQGILRAIEITELEDALDPLERLAEPGAFPGAQASLAQLRIALGAAHASTARARGWAALHARLALHLGVRDEEEPLRRELSATEARLRAESRAAIAALPGGFTSDGRLAGAPPLLVPGACDEAAPPERVLVCASLHAIAEARDSSSVAAAWVSVHDLAAMANWAVAMAADPVDPERATEARPLMGRAPPEVKARLARFAAVRPVACVAVARMAAMLGDGEVGARSSRAKTWLAFGDAPLDVVAREGVAGGR